MKLSRIVLALVLVAVFAGVAQVSQRTDAPATKLAAAAQKFVDSLTPDQKKQAVMPFDSPDRINWNFVPLQDKNKIPTRKGLRLQDMNPEQKSLALALVEAGTSASGNKQAATIMSLESILKVQEGPKAANVRDPEWYFFTVFGTPGKTGQWGWRVEGHHLSINYTLDNNEVVSVTPTFFGANPSTVKDGPKAGERILPEVEDYARELFKSLDDKQLAEASRPKQFGEPKAKSATPDVGGPVGVPATKLTDKQREMLMKLVRAYADRLPPEIAAAELKRVQEAGTDKIHFAYSGATEPGKQYSYRIQGPSFVIEFLNVQADSAGNPANHIHSCWRRIDGDFGIQAKK
jgi:Protein of unknown function (DUF3500)